MVVKVASREIYISLMYRSNIRVSRRFDVPFLVVYYSWWLFSCLGLLRNMVGLRYRIFRASSRRWAVLRGPKCHKVGQKHYGFRARFFLVTVALNPGSAGFWDLLFYGQVLGTLLVNFSTNLLQLYYIRVRTAGCLVEW